MDSGLTQSYSFCQRDKTLHSSIMESLRSRPSQAPRKAQRTPTKLSKQGPGPAPRDRNKTRIDDKIKKRMSMRYADISSPTELTGLPAMPSLAGMTSPPVRGMMGEGEEDVRDRTGSKDEAKVAVNDKKLLSAEDFDPDAFLKLKLANSTEAELKLLQSSLHKAKDDTASELQRSVFKNYAEFVLISKEISVLENEMLELKELLSDYKSMPSMLHIPDPTAISSSSLSTYKRSSVADLRVLYFNQMQAIHASIEGAAKFVPTTPGRHVVGEMEGVLSLNAATYKIINKVKFVVLNDAVLVAKRRRRNVGGREGTGSTVNEGKLVAERCWALNEMLVLDTKDSASMTNVFKIRHGKETHVYRTDTPQEKKSLLSQFRQVAEELSAKRRKEREGEHERRKSMWQGGGGDRSTTIPPMPEWMADLAKKGGEIPGSGNDAKEKAERDARFVGDWSDDLTVAIALKEWPKAVDLVEQGQAKLSTIPLLASKLPALTNQLTTSLLASLSLMSNRKSSVVLLISLLNRLKAGAPARSTFLEMRIKVIRGHVRKIRFEGHIGSYIGDLATVYFTGIKHTADWYLASFKENEVASSFITWAKEGIQSYAETFRKQVYSKDVDPKVVEDAIQITHTQSKKLLQEYGLDFRYLLDELLVQHPKEAVKATAAFSLDGHRTSKPAIQSSPPISEPVEQPPPSLQLPPAPTPPTLLDPPIRRRRSPVPSSHSSSTSSLPHFIGTGESLHPPGTPNTLISNLGLRNASSPSSYSNGAPLNNTARPAVYPGGLVNRSRTPSVTQQWQGGPPPTSAPIPDLPLTSPVARRPRSPPLSANPFRAGTVGGGGVKERVDRDRPPRSARGSPVPYNQGSLPPRSINRPGSATGHRLPPVAVPQREGMI